MVATSDAVINTSFSDAKEAKRPISSEILFTIDESLRLKLNKHRVSQVKSAPSTLTIDKITAEYKSICEIIEKHEEALSEQRKKSKKQNQQNLLLDEERALLEEYKAALMKAVQDHLTRHYANKKAEQKIVQQEQQGSNAKKIAGWVYFIILMTFEFLPMLIGNLMYASETLSALTPYLPFIVPAPIMLAIGLGCVFNSVFGGICFVGPLLLKSLGIEYQQTEQPLVTAYRQQVSTGRHINSRLLAYNEISSEEYRKYKTFALCVNDDLRKLKDYYPEYTEQSTSKWFTRAMSVFIGIQAISSSLFLAAALLGAIIQSPLSEAALIAVMPGAILLLAIPFTVAFFIVAQKLRINSAGSALDPAVGQHEIAKKEVDNFRCKDQEFDKVYHNKLNYEKSQHQSNETILDLQNKIADRDELLRKLIKLNKKEIMLETSLALPSQPDTKDDLRSAAGGRTISTSTESLFTPQMDADSLSATSTIASPSAGMC